MCKTLLSLKLLLDADDWPFFWKNETNILYFLPLPPFKNRSRAKHWTSCFVNSFTHLFTQSPYIVMPLLIYRAGQVRNCGVTKIIADLRTFVVKIADYFLF